MDVTEIIGRGLAGPQTPRELDLARRPKRIADSVRQKLIEAKPGHIVLLDEEEWRWSA